MKKFFLLLIISSLLFSCSFKNQLTYISNGKEDNVSKINGDYKKNNLVKEVTNFILKDKKRPICTPFLK